MHTIHRSLSALAIIALVATLFSAVTTTSASAGADYQKPKAGECRNFTSENWHPYNNSPVVSCVESHTLRTIKVGTYPKRFERLSKRKFNLAVWEKAYPGCAKAFRSTLGRTAAIRALSPYTWSTFVPNNAQRKKGARWYRCDLVIVTGDRPLIPLPNGSFLNPINDSNSLCLQPKKLWETSCSLSHSHRATGTFRVKGKSYPSVKKWKSAALKQCPPQVSSGGYRYSLRPFRLAWQNKFRTGRCYSATTARLAAPSVGGREVGVLPDPGVHGYGGRG